MPEAERGGAEPLKEMALARAGVCRLLARVFSTKPSADLIAGLRESSMLEVLAELGVVFDDSFIEGEAEELAAELAVEYTRLFIGPGQHIAPYESVFVQGDAEDGPRLWGDATQEVARFYEEAGLEVESSTGIPDHIGIELEAMAELAAAEGVRRERGDAVQAEVLWELQQRFAREHLAKWLPEFSRRVAEQAGSSFYSGMAVLISRLPDYYEED